MTDIRPFRWKIDKADRVDDNKVMITVTGLVEELEHLENSVGKYFRIEDEDVDRPPVTGGPPVTGEVTKGYEPSSQE